MDIKREGSKQSKEVTLKIIKDAKAVEEGKLNVNDLLIESDVKELEQRLALVTKVIVSALEQDDDHSITEQLRHDASNVKEVPLPIEKKKYPYTSALLFYRSKQLTLEAGQEKSVYADTFPGIVPVDTPIVDKKKVKVNYDYADLSYLRMLVPPENWQSTGLYAPAGTDITIELPNGTEDLDVQVGAHTDELGHLLTWDRAPIVAIRQTLKAGQNKISSPFGGLIYLIPTESKTSQVSDVTISGAVNAPYFVKDETDIAEWHATIQHYGAPWAEFQGDHVIHTVPASVIAEMDSPDELMKNWDDMIVQYNKLVGLKEGSPEPHGIPDRQHRITSDIQISAGYMHAGYPIMIPNVPAAPHTVQFKHVMDLHDGWGFWHEMGHEYQQLAWFWDDIVEVSVNIYSLYIQDYFNNPSRLLEKDKEGNTYYDIAFKFLEDTSPDKHFNQIGLFERLVMVRQLQIAYGWEFYTDLHIAYRELPESDLPDHEDEQAKVDKFVAMCSKVSGDNLLHFFKLWGMPYTERANIEVEALNLSEPKTEIWTVVENSKNIK